MGKPWEYMGKLCENTGTLWHNGGLYPGKPWEIMETMFFKSISTCLFFGMCFHFWFWYVLVIKFQTISSPSTRF